MMRRKIANQNICILLLPLLAATVLFLQMMLTVYAAPPLLVDEADVLSSAQESELLAQLEEISGRLDIDVVVYTVESLNGADSLDFADDIYVYNDYGRGNDHSGIILLHKPSSIPGETDFAITCDGSVRERISTNKLDDMLDRMADAIVDGRDNGNYLPAYQRYIEMVDDNMKSPLERILQMALGSTFLAPIAGFILAFLHMGKQKNKLRSVRRQRSATAYVISNGVQLQVSQDQFVNRTLNKTPVVRNESNNRGNSSGNRPASVHTHSSGRTLSGGSRRV